MNLHEGQPNRAKPVQRDPTQPPIPQDEKIAQIEKSVTHLLVATKQLLEILTAWSRHEATEVAVSDVYVRLGYEFNIACRAFNGIGVGTEDLGPVPDLLRGILEDALSNEPSQTSLEQYLPHIRDIIVNLLQGLKRKQQRLRQRNEGGPFTAPDAPTPRQSSSGSIRSTVSTVSTVSTADERQSANPVQRVYSSDTYGPNGAATPNSRVSSAPVITGPMERTSPATTEGGLPQRTKSFGRTPFSARVTETARPPTVAPAPSFAESTPSQASEDVTSGQADSPFMPQPTDSTQLGMQSKSHDALAALQRGGELERRASRRLSAYQIQKHLGSNANGTPIIPPSQNSPIPNRGRETREAMSAARMRGSPLANSERSRVDTTQSPPRPRIPQGQTEKRGRGEAENEPRAESPTLRTLEGKYQPTTSTQSGTGQVSAALAQPQPQTAPPTLATASLPIASSITPAVVVSETPGSTANDVTVFLQYKNQTKKFPLSEGLEGLSIAQLQLAFIDKFAWNSHSNGADLPEIYIQDPVSGIRYELEDMDDVKDNSVLMLNVDALDDVKRHFDDGMGGVRELLETIHSVVDGHHSALQLVSANQQDTAKNIARLNALPPTSAAPSTSAPLSGAGRLVELQSLRRDLSTMRQTYTTLTTDMEASMSDLSEKANNIKAAAVTASIPTFDTSSGRAYVDEGRKTLSDDSERIINRVDDLADLVEDLRKDVVARGVRPLPRQLESVNKEIALATAELKKLQEFIKREKPTWTKIWRTELEAVYDDQKSLRMQEELAADLDKDLTEAANTFALVEEATKQQNVQSNTGSASNTPTRTRSRTVNVTRAMTIDSSSSLDPQKAKDTVLGEVRALQPNHETRLEAIERAEKARLKDLESRNEGAFKKELGDFVDEGRFKKTGGFEELEKARREREESLRRGTWTGKEKETGMGTAPATKDRTSSVDTVVGLMQEVGANVGAGAEITEVKTSSAPAPSSLEGTVDEPPAMNEANTDESDTNGDIDTKAPLPPPPREGSDQYFEPAEAAESVPLPAPKRDEGEFLQPQPPLEQQQQQPQAEVDFEAGSTALPGAFP